MDEKKSFVIPDCCRRQSIKISREITDMGMPRSYFRRK